MYTVAFCIFWALLATIVIYNGHINKGGCTLKASAMVYWGFAAVLVLFQAMRPIGLARDDGSYLQIYNAICPILECGHWIQSTRDWGWYSFVGLLKSISTTPQVMLWLGAAGLLFKLVVIYSISKRPLPVLLLFTGVYYQVQDITAWRVSLALTIFMGAIWVYVRGRTYLGALIMLASGVFHKQAFVAPLVLLGGFLQRRLWLFLGVTLAPLILVCCGIYPDLLHWLPSLSDGIASIAFHQGLDSYVGFKSTGAYQNIKSAPVVCYPLVLLMLWLLLVKPTNKNLLTSLMAGCVVMGCLFLWGFASLSDAQVRFFDFFMMPTVLLAGMHRLTFAETSAVIAVSGIFVVKYNVFTHLFLI